MLISHKHKFIKIDIPKTGTRTLRETLNPIGAVDVLGEPNPGNFYQHASIADVEIGFLKNAWDFDKYFKFTVVRNPWVRYTSFLRWMETVDNCLDLSAFKTRGKFNLGLIIKKNPSQDYYLFKNNTLSVDMVGRLENLNKDFAVFCNKVGITPIPNLKHSNKSSYKKPYTEYYNQELIDMVAEREKWVIDNFNYDYKSS